MESCSPDMSFLYATKMVAEHRDALWWQPLGHGVCIGVIRHLRQTCWHGRHCPRLLLDSCPFDHGGKILYCAALEAELRLGSERAGRHASLKHFCASAAVHWRKPGKEADTEQTERQIANIANSAIGRRTERGSPGFLQRVSTTVTESLNKARQTLKWRSFLTATLALKQELVKNVVARSSLE